jgi:hypothetical protein
MYTSLCSLFAVNTSKLSYNLLQELPKLKLKMNGINVYKEGSFSIFGQDSSVTRAHTNTNIEQRTLLFPI